MLGQCHVDSWKQRIQQIYLAELTATPLMLARHAKHFAGNDCIFFVDNEGALASLVRSGSGEPDAEMVTHVVHALATMLGARVWWDWVDSKSNPADPLSRAGLLTSQVVSGEWRGEELHHVPYWRVGESPWAVAKRLLDHDWSSSSTPPALPRT